MNKEFLLQTLATVFVTVYGKAPAPSVGCFMCSSKNNSDPNCHDPFNPIQKNVYHKDCKTGVPRRNGLFPAHFCIKMSGTSVSDKKVEIIVRTCSTQNMGHHCGSFILEGEKYKGCVTTCTTLGCNVAPSGRTGFSNSFLISSVLTTLLLFG